MSINMPEKKQRPAFRPLYALLALLLLAGGVAVYWHASGRVSLVGEVKDSVISLSPGISGTFSRVDVREGQRVGKGQPLALLDSTAQRKTLAEEQQKLAQFEALLPPQYARVPGSGTYGQPQDDETLEERLVRQRKEEAAAERRLQNAADREAQAAVTYNRASMLASQGKLPASERDVAEAALDEARRESQAAKVAFESRSRARSGTGAEIRRVKENQDAIGADALPANLRIKNYELQRERARAAAADLEATVLRAPEDGIVTEIAAKPGAPATAGMPCLYLASLDKAVTVVAPASDDLAKKLRLRQQCRLEIAGAPDNPYAGYIANFLPKSNIPADKDAEQTAASGIRVQIAITGPASKEQSETAKPGEETSPALYMLGGSKADITVLLRAPLYAQDHRSPAGSETSPASQQSNGAATAPAAAPAIESTAVPAGAPSTTVSPVVPPAPPVLTPSGAPATPASVPTPPATEPGNGQNAASPATGQPSQERPAGPDNPEGRLLPPVHPPVAQPESPDTPQGPLDSNRHLPQLPPMQAPEKLTGSPLPDPQNNPSLVTPQVLEREENSQR